MNPAGFLPDHLGIVWDEVVAGRASARFTVEKFHMAPNGYLHAGSVVSLADSVCGLGCMASRPEGAISFTTIELKSNFLSSAQEGHAITCAGRLVHGGRTTQVWDAEVVNQTTGKTIALFRCTQMLIYPRT